MKKLIIKMLPFYVTGGVEPVAEGLCYQTYNYTDNKRSDIMLTSKYFKKFITLN